LAAVFRIGVVCGCGGGVGNGHVVGVGDGDGGGGVLLAAAAPSVACPEVVEYVDKGGGEYEEDEDEEDGLEGLEDVGRDGWKFGEGFAACEGVGLERDRGGGGEATHCRLFEEI